MRPARGNRSCWTAWGWRSDCGPIAAWCAPAKRRPASRRNSSFPAGIPSLPLNLTLLKSVSIVGVFWGAHVAREPEQHAANMADLMRLYAEGKIKPRVSRTFPLHRAGEAIRALGDRQALGKIVVTVED